MNKIALTCVIASCALAAFAQNGVNTPYSRYGFGIQSERAMGFNKGMSGVAQGFRNGREINVANPASYSAVDSLTAIFDFGISLQNNNYKMDGLQQNLRNSSFDYFAFQFRAFRHVGMTIGLMPITNIKYNFSSQSESLSGTENVTSSYTFTGDGGLREVFFGAGWQPINNFSIGTNLRYVWGDYTHNAGMTFNDNNIFNRSHTYKGEVSDFSLQAGMQYVLPVTSKDKVVVGGTYTFGNPFGQVSGNSATRTIQTLSNGVSEEATTDTIRKAFQLPHALAVGVTYYHSNTLRIGVDFELQKWSKCLFPNQQTGFSDHSPYVSTKGQLNDRMKIAAGIDWTPNAYSQRLFQRCTYKAGGYYTQTYAKADPTGTITEKPYEVGVSAGMTIPLSTWLTSPRINMSVQWAHAQVPYLNASTNLKNTLTENYLRFCLGITFCENWFYKWKVE